MGKMKGKKLYHSQSQSCSLFVVFRMSRLMCVWRCRAACADCRGRNKEFQRLMPVNKSVCASRGHEKKPRTEQNPVEANEHDKENMTKGARARANTYMRLSSSRVFCSVNFFFCTVWSFFFFFFFQWAFGGEIWPGVRTTYESPYIYI